MVAVIFLILLVLVAIIHIYYSLDDFAFYIIFYIIFFGFFSFILPYKQEKQIIDDFFITKTNYNIIIETQDSVIVEDNIKLYKSEKDDIIVYYKIEYNLWGIITQRSLKYEFR